MTEQKFLSVFKSVLWLGTLFITLGAEAGETVYTYQNEQGSYHYSVIESGDNYNFEFDKSPGDTIEQLNAGVHVLQSIYDDTSIDLDNRRPYIRERATCSLFKARFYDYTFCIFPNDFTPERKERFRGFVTQMPNWKWMLTWNLLPLVLVVSLFFLLWKKAR